MCSPSSGAERVTAVGVAEKCRRNGRAGGDPDGAASSHLDVGGASRADLTNHDQADRPILGCGGRVRGPDRIAVHRRVVPRRQRRRRHDRLGDDARDRRDRGHGLGPQRTFDRGEDAIARLVDAKAVCCLALPHRRDHLGVRHGELYQLGRDGVEAGEQLLDQSGA